MPRPAIAHINAFVLQFLISSSSLGNTMFARLQPSILQRCPLQSIESSLQSTCALLQAANGGAATFSTARPSSSDGPNARTNRPSSGPGAQSQRPPRDSQGPKKLQRREFDRPQQFGGASAGDNSGNRQGQRGPKRTPGGGQRRPWQKGGAGGGGGGGGNLLDAALGTVRGTPPTTGPAALLQVRKTYGLLYSSEYVSRSDFYVKKTFPKLP